jgi:hypothetical protein
VSGLAEGLQRLRVEVRRFRRDFRELDGGSRGGPGSALLVLDPSQPVRGTEVEHLLTWTRGAGGGDLVLAGPGARAIMRCFGYTVDWRYFDSVQVQPAGGAAMVVEPGRPWPKVAGVLAATTDSVVSDSSRREDTGVTTCAVPPISRVDTLLLSGSGRVVGLRLTRADTAGSVLLVADAALFRNQALRQTAAGPWALGLLVGRYDRVVFDEAHHGFEEGGSLAGATLAWSRRSPWGWAIWQLTLVGTLSLLGQAFRFGPPRRVIERRRRSPLEHVRALATALAAARGHDVAIGAIIGGLRRRLQPAGERPRGDWRPWLGHLKEQVQSRRGADAVGTLIAVTRPGQSAEAVLRAANAVEDVWEELRP